MARERLSCSLGVLSPPGAVLRCHLGRISWGPVATPFRAALPPLRATRGGWWRWDPLPLCQLWLRQLRPVALSDSPVPALCLPRACLAGYTGRLVEVGPICHSDPGMTSANMQASPQSYTPQVSVMFLLLLFGDLG